MHGRAVLVVADDFESLLGRSKKRMTSKTEGPSGGEGRAPESDYGDATVSREHSTSWMAGEGLPSNEGRSFAFRY